MKQEHWAAIVTITAAAIMGVVVFDIISEKKSDQPKPEPKKISPFEPVEFEGHQYLVGYYGRGGITHAHSCQVTRTPRRNETMSRDTEPL